jgi:hypothetical protein
MIDLEAIKAREAATAPGPWVPSERQSDAIVGPGTSDFGTHDYTAHYGGRFVCESVDGAEKAFIINARADIPALIEEVERLKAINVGVGKTIVALRTERDYYRSLYASGGVAS